MFKEIEEITFQPPPHCQQLAEYLNRRLEKPSACVKLKVLKIMLYLIQNGHVSFRTYLRRNDGYIKLATMYNGPPDPLLGMAPYENIRTTAQELLDILFSPDMIQQDESQDLLETGEKSRPQLGGLGSAGNTKGKYEGFGSSPLDREETFKGKMIDMLEKLMHPTDETAEKIKSALTSSPGEYEAVPVDLMTDSDVDIQPAEAQKATVKIKAHVPGRAGGGWESDDDIQQEEVSELQQYSSSKRGSNVSVDSLEKIEPSAAEVTPVKEIVNEFCILQEWPVPLSQLNDACKKSATLNCGDVLHAIGNILLQSPSKVSDISLTRALLMLEWFLRTDLITPAAFSKAISVPLNRVLKSESIGQDVMVKAQKIRLILDKLQPRQG
ncbi:AP-4 complex accessory subunit Tepsin-like isoform X2 [Zootermopsis nevadensis]|nr:AP-4 complex accessory subunit Tepsin-like isoform X2 [Zootermopsis nevadensis]XP_021920670.1 AP-4 complex accessory subunit Tepsin-like isoform X2 [Zootermopsis nevadensis]XP_021920671.1 AP-4 complex accessory subunit Tepsin-like isoform X2 [Zootermopsis nevadensis]